MTNINTFFSDFDRISEDKSLFFNLSEFSPVGIYVTNNNGDCLYTNKKWQQMAGLSLLETLGDGWKKALYPDDVNRIFFEWQKAVDNKKEWNIEYRFINNLTKKVSWILGVAKPLYGQDGEQRGYLGINIDITHQKSLESHNKQLELEKRKAESENWEKERLIETMNKFNQELDLQMLSLKDKLHEADDKQLLLMQEKSKTVLQHADLLHRNQKMIRQINTYQEQIQVLQSQIQDLTRMFYEDRDVL